MSAATAAREAFLYARRSYLGGTDVAAIVGLSPWASPLSVYIDKVAPEAGESADTLPMRRGLALERFIADEFCRAMPGLVTYHPRPVVREDWGFPAGASLDWYVASADRPRTPVAVLETKTAFSYVSSRQWDAGNLELPDSYFVQVQWYLAVTGMDLCYAAADTGKPELTIVPLGADRKVQERLVEAAREFWQTCVLTRTPPQPIGSDADHEALSRLWPETVPDPPVVLEGEAEALLSDYLAHGFEAKQHGAAAELAKQRLQALMGERESALVGSWRITWKKQSRTTLDAKRLKAELPEVAAAYSRTTETRVFGIPKEVAP